jgi:hypothetical protein
LIGLIVVGAIFSNPNKWGVKNPTAKKTGIPTSYVRTAQAVSVFYVNNWLNNMTSKLKVEFIDNSSSQYDQNASIIKYNQSGIVEGATKKLGRLYLGAYNLT